MLDVFSTKLYCFLGGKKPETVSHLLLSCPTPLCEETLLFPSRANPWHSSSSGCAHYSWCFGVQSLSHVHHGDCSTPGLPVLVYFPELILTHACCIDDAIQPSHPLSPTSLPALNLSQHQNLFPEPESDSESALHIRWPEY